jgi:hypothetical protein
VSAFTAEPSVFEQDELVDLLADDPELLAFADAIAQTQADARVVTSRGGAYIRRVRAHKVLVAAAVLVGVLLAVGATLAATLGGFSHWLSGTPGNPASPAAQAQFAASNAHSFSAFPARTVLHELIVEHAGAATYVLYGFRSGDQLCLRLVATGISGQPVLSCAPRLALVHSHAPVEVAIVDYPFGLRAPPPRSHALVAPAASASFGFVADGVSRVTVHSDGQTQQAKVASDAFLAIRVHPSAASRIDEVQATVQNGGSVSVPFTPSPVGFSPHQASGAIPGPHTVQRTLGPGTIGWLTHHQARGLSLAQAHIPRSVLVGYHLSGGIVYARVLRPDRRSNLRLVVYLIGKRGHNLCLLTIVNNVAGGGCSVHLPPVFASLTLDEGGNQFAVLSGLARDGVASLNLYLADGERWPVALTNNAYAVEVPRDKFPVALVAYDTTGRIVGIAHNRGF